MRKVLFGAVMLGSGAVLGASGDWLVVKSAPVQCINAGKFNALTNIAQAQNVLPPGVSKDDVISMKAQRDADCSGGYSASVVYLDEIPPGSESGVLVDGVSP